jgi:predicted ATP-dependent serine protease
VVLGGIPGAGKSTLLHRLFGTTGAETQPMRNHDGVLLLDSEQAPNHVRRRLQPLSYSLWRLLAHLLQIRTYPCRDPFRGAARRP